MDGIVSIRGSGSCQVATKHRRVGDSHLDLKAVIAFIAVSNQGVTTGEPNGVIAFVRRMRWKSRRQR